MRLYTYLTDEEFSLLREMAWQDGKDPKQLMRWLILQEAHARGMKMSGNPTTTMQLRLRTPQDPP